MLVKDAGATLADPVQDRNPIGRLQDRARRLVADAEQTGRLSGQLKPDHPVRQQPDGEERKVYGQVEPELERQRFSREGPGV